MKAQKVTPNNKSLFQLEQALRQLEEMAEVRAKLLDAVAKEKKKQYDSFIKAGFSPDQSMKLISQENK